MPDGDEGYDEEEQRGPGFKKQMEVVTVTEYGNDEFDHDSRDQRGVMAAATRVDDRSFEIPLNRGGDTVYRRFCFWGRPLHKVRPPSKQDQIALDDSGEIKVDNNGWPVLTSVSEKGSATGPLIGCNLVDPYGKPLPQSQRERTQLLREVGERFVRCPMQKTMQQATRTPSHMIAKKWLDERLNGYKRLQRDNPGLLVPYPMEGLRIRRMEKEARRAIRLKLPGPGDKDYSRDLPEWRRLPDWLHKAEGVQPQDGIGLRRHIKYLVRIGDLDLRALTLLAHFDGFLDNITAEQVYNNLIATIEFAKQQEPEKYANFGWEPPENATDEELIIWRGLYDDLLDRYYDRWYPSEQFYWREYLSDIINRYPETPEGKAKAKEALMDLTIHVIEPPEIWMEYSRSDEEKLRNAEIKLADLENSGHWNVKINWRAFKYFAEPIESWRDWARMIKHWHQTKQQRSNRDAGDVEKSDTKNSRRNDWGGIWQPVAYKNDWRFMKLWDWAQDVAPLPQRPMRDDLEADGSDPDRLWNEFASWFRDDNTTTLFGETMSVLNARVHIMSRAWFWVQPEWDMAHDGVLISRLNAKRISWVEMMDKYVRGQNSNSGMGVLPRFNKFVEEVLARVRNYEDEDDWLGFDEYTKRDPIDGWLHQRAIVSTPVTNDVNLRLDGVYRDSPMVHLTQENSLSGRDFLLEMWRRQPEDPVRGLLERDLEEAEANRITNTLKVVQKGTDGLPSKVIPQGVRLQPRHPLGLWTPRDGIERVVGDLRTRAVRWMRRRAAEMDYAGHARAFTGPVFGGWVGDGFPFRCNDDEWSEYLWLEMGRQSWLNGIYDARVGLGEAMDDIPMSDEDKINWRRNNVLSRRQNIWYAAGREPGEKAHIELVKWVSEWVLGCGVLNVKDKAQSRVVEKMATMIVDKGGLNEVIDLVPRGIKGREDLVEAICEVYLPYHGHVLDM